MNLKEKFILSVALNVLAGRPLDANRIESRKPIVEGSSRSCSMNVPCNLKQGVGGTVLTQPWKKEKRSQDEAENISSQLKLNRNIFSSSGIKIQEMSGNTATNVDRHVQRPLNRFSQNIASKRLNCESPRMNEMHGIVLALPCREEQQGEEDRKRRVISFSGRKIYHKFRGSTSCSNPVFEGSQMVSGPQINEIKLSRDAEIPSFSMNKGGNHQDFPKNMSAATRNHNWQFNETELGATSQVAMSENSTARFQMNRLQPISFAAVNCSQKVNESSKNNSCEVTAKIDGRLSERINFPDEERASIFYDQNYCLKFLGSGSKSTEQTNETRYSEDAESVMISRNNRDNHIGFPQNITTETANKNWQFSVIESCASRQVPVSQNFAAGLSWNQCQPNSFSEVNFSQQANQNLVINSSKVSDDSPASNMNWGVLRHGSLNEGSQQLTLKMDARSNQTCQFSVNASGASQEPMFRTTREQPLNQSHPSLLTLADNQAGQNFISSSGAFFYTQYNETPTALGINQKVQSQVCSGDNNTTSNTGKLYQETPTASRPVVVTNADYQRTPQEIYPTANQNCQYNPQITGSSATQQMNQDLTSLSKGHAYTYIERSTPSLGKKDMQVSLLNADKCTVSNTGLTLGSWAASTQQEASMDLPPLEEFEKFSDFSDFDEFFTEPNVEYPESNEQHRERGQTKLSFPNQSDLGNISDKETGKCQVDGWSDEGTEAIPWLNFSDLEWEE